MTCPHCGETMEGETVPLAARVNLGAVIKYGRREPSGHYYCHTCDSEWVWYRSRKKLRKIDGSIFSEEKYLVC